MLPTLSYTESGQSTQLSWTSTHFSPTRAATPATCRVWLDCTPPIETRVSQPFAMASATRYSSFARFVTAIGDAGVAVLPLGVDGRASEVLCQPIQPVYR